MSAHIPCSCKGKRKERVKNWYVSLRNGNHSHFEKPKGCFHRSDYSTVRCSECYMYMRSKEGYVDDLPDERDIRALNSMRYSK